ncbi:MAG: hypothetical protein AB7F82_04720 [Alphaproteobacteria bacterium]
MPSRLVRTEKIWLKTHPEINERMIQDMIAENPAILELGDVELKDRERPQKRAGRLDLLLQDVEDNRRYEVEIQLGETDEAHIIRTIEYWDIERKRYPQYDHCAVLVAEDITTRFLNVMNLFNGSIPFIAIQMNAFRAGNEVALSFITVLNEFTRGLVDEDEEIQFKASREYWEQEKTNKDMLKLVDEIYELIRELYPNSILNYNKRYIGIMLDGKPVNFVVFKPRQQSLRFEVFLKFSEEMNQKIDAFGLERQAYNYNFKYYPVRLSKGDAHKHKDALKELITLAYEQRIPG